MLLTFGALFLVVLVSTCWGKAISQMHPLPPFSSGPVPPPPPQFFSGPPPAIRGGQGTSVCGSPYTAFHRPTNQCLPLLEQGVCQMGQWLVLNQATMEPECQYRNCGLCSVAFSEEPNRCVSPEYPGERCGQNQILAMDQFGLGHCECREGGYIYWPEDGNCHRLFSRGPCEPGNLFLFDKENKTALCKRNLCPDGQIYWLPRGDCVLENDTTLCSPPLNLTLTRLADREFALTCQRLAPHAFAATVSFRRCDPGSIWMTKEGCEEPVPLNPCPPGHEGDFFGGCRDSSGYESSATVYVHEKYI
ncbi:unnamed protein product [Darwinula stevensoni]|uniref:DUF4789 domain-containing protein n=1 Tax=Darwinula stevensoni TaxID=69355 RepID=A0A7R9A6I0_9CRUS|nr:unnamed protein product [Darwinula stevensoni]CAG0889249.1 unnamed protein product [Darwinula stevensoni]